MNQKRKFFKDSIQAKKKWGQHFLVSEHHRDKLLQSITSIADDYPPYGWFEIGPGTGSLTELLISTNRPIEAVDIDPDAIEHMKTHYPDIAVQEIDAAKVESYQIADQTIITGNLPYNIASRIMVDLAIHHGEKPLLFMIQKEVGQKLRFKSFTLLGAWLNLWYNIKIVFHLPPSAYHPQPRVYSSVVRLIPKQGVAEIPLEERRAKLLVLKKLFQFPNKLLRNNLANWLDADAIESLYQGHDWDKSLRLAQENYSEVLEIIYQESIKKPLE